MIGNFLSTLNIPHIASIVCSITLSLIGITSIIVFHEFGHFIFCKLFKVYTPTFSIGIGKKLYTKMIGDTEFCLSAGPLGGYVEIATEATAGKNGFNSIHYLKNPPKYYNATSHQIIVRNNVCLIDPAIIQKHVGPSSPLFFHK